MAKVYEKVKKNQNGFTLMELMVVLVIIGILVGIAVPVYTNVQKTAKENADLANVRIIEGAIQVYLIENPDKEISVLKGDVDDQHALIAEKYLDKPPEASNKGIYTIDLDEKGEVTVGITLVEEDEPSQGG